MTSRTRQKRLESESLIKTARKSSKMVVQRLKVSDIPANTGLEQLEELVDILRQELDKLTKNYNSTVSENQAKKREINALRKERSLMDMVFRDLELQILKDEGRLMKILRKNKFVNDQLIEKESSLNYLKESMRKSQYENFQDIMKDQFKQYKEGLMNGCLLESLSSSEKLNGKKLPLFVTNARPIIANRRRKQTTVEDNDSHKQNELSFVERTLFEIQVETETVGIDGILEAFRDSKTNTEELFDSFIEIEEQVLSKVQ